MNSPADKTEIIEKKAEQYKGTIAQKSETALVQKETKPANKSPDRNARHARFDVV